MVVTSVVEIVGVVTIQVEPEIVDGSLTGTDWLRAGSVMVAAIILALVVARVTRRLLGAAMSTGFATNTVARISAYIVFTMGLFYALSTLGARVGPLLGALGLGGLVLALALQKVVENFVGGFGNTPAL